MMANVTLKFNASLTTSDPQKNPVLIVGQHKALKEVGFSEIQQKLGARVTEELFRTAIEKLHPSPTDSCPLYLNFATVAVLPKNCSRHNTPSRAHAITKIVKNNTSGKDEFVVILCEKQDVFASACSVARAFPLYSRKAKNQTNPHSVTVEFLVPDKSGEYKDGISASDVECVAWVTEGIQMTARIVDTPCNEMNTDDFLDEVKRVGKILGLSPQIIRGEELKERGFGGIYSVGQAAIHPPALAVLSHTPSDAKETIALVGKGIVYDTGGLSIKSRTGMLGMKRDCGGAAAILGGFYCAVKMGFRDNLHAIFCLAENAVGPKATRPDDIVTMYSGRSVEINNTDAEGRLVLADGVSFAEKDLKANIILDMATLTGAQGISTGKYHGAVVTNSEEWEQAVVKAGLTSGDLVHPLPYCPELHFSEFGSFLADMKNSVADRSNAQSSCAALFIGSHIGFDFPGKWIHVDMAATVCCGERATGYGVALLINLFGHLSHNPMLQQLSPVVSQNGPLESASFEATYGYQHPDI